MIGRAVLLTMFATRKAASAKQIALVTGANRGIGRELCRQLVALDYEVILGSRNEAKGFAVWKEMGSPSSLHPIPLDVTSEQSVQSARDLIEMKFDGVLDVLVNNAGIHYDTHNTASTADLDYVKETLDTNLMGAWRCSQTFVPLLQRASEITDRPPPRIVNVSSGAGSLQDMSSSWTPSYSVSKAAMNALTIKLAKEFPSWKINSVCPGWVATDMGGTSATSTVEEGARSVLWAATLDSDGPTCGYFRHGRPIAW
mmetsp:Transcript_26119/g.61442  ORF Transcript_26119/g.61442 Transcript_26119/m.61442 type:complete len:256 (+) Transcript_26119:3-770(+)